MRALFFVAAGSFLCTANAQTGTLDQVSPATNAGFNGDAPSLLWQQEVQAGLSGQLEGFSLSLTGPVGAQLSVRVRIGPGWNTTPSVFGTTITKLTANTEVIFVDCSASSINLSAGSAFVLEMVGNSTGMGIQGSYVAPPGAPLYGPQLFLNTPACYADCGWRLAFSSYMFTAPSPTVYCTAKTNSLGCVPTIGFTGFPSVGAGSGFVIKATSVINNKNGLLFYGVNGQATTPFQGGTLCVQSQIKRTPGTNSGGNPPPNDCSGVFAIDMNSFASGGLGGTPLAQLSISGTVVNCQWWGRDPGFPAPNNTTLSNGLEYTVP